MQSLHITTKVVSSNPTHGMVKGVLDTTLCDKVCQWFYLSTSLSSTNKTDRKDVTEILLKVALNTITQTHFT